MDLGYITAPQEVRYTGGASLLPETHSIVDDSYFGTKDEESFYFLFSITFLNSKYLLLSVKMVWENLFS